MEPLPPRRLSFVGMSINDVWQAIQEEERRNGASADAEEVIWAEVFQMFKASFSAKERCPKNRVHKKRWKKTIGKQ